jgi:hypothetical protein
VWPCVRVHMEQSNSLSEWHTIALLLQIFVTLKTIIFHRFNTFSNYDIKMRGTLISNLEYETF